MEELTPIDFIAQLINDREAKAKGYTASTRWGTLRPDLKKKYLKEAKQIFEEWKKVETETWKSREALGLEMDRLTRKVGL